MRWNGKFEYKKRATATRNSDGFLVEGTATGWQTGSFCQIERNAPAVQHIGDDGQKIDYTYELYMEPKYGTILAYGDEIRMTLDNGSTITKTILGTDVTNKKTLAIWV